MAEAFTGDQGTDAAMQQAFQQPDLNPPEQLAIEQPAPVAPEAGHVTNVFNPEGKLVSLPTIQLEDAVKEGYRPATTEEVDQAAKEEQYGGLGQQALAALEGAAETGTFGLSTAIETAAGVPKEDIRARREVNPIAHGIGQIAGLINPLSVEGKVLQVAGEAAGSLVRHKIGSAAVRGAVDNALFQAGDEVSKLFSGQTDPNQAVQTAVTNIGLSGLIGVGAGAALGSINPLWQAAASSKIGGTLKAIANRTGGIDGEIPAIMDEAIAKSGMEVAPEIRAGLSSNPEVQNAYQVLQESSSKSGMQAQAALRDFKTKASDSILSSLGKSPEYVANLGDMSEHEAGTMIKSALHEELKRTIDPISEQFNVIKDKYKNLELPKASLDAMAERVTELANEKGWLKAPSSVEYKMTQNILKELPLQKTLSDLNNYASTVGSEASRQQMWHFGSQMKGIFRGLEDDLVTQRLGEEAPELLASHAGARSAYRDTMSMIDDLNSRLHVGKYSGPESFLRALSEMRPEDLLRRTAGKNDVAMLNLLQERFPEVAQSIRDVHLDRALKIAESKALPGETINSKVFFNALDKMSPELRHFVLPVAKTEQLKATQELLNALPRGMNPSGTARTLDSLWNKVPGSALGIVAMLKSHNPVLGYIVNKMANWIGHEAPDATRLAMLKFIGSGQKVDATGFKAMVDFVDRTIKGENLVNKSVKNVFKSTIPVLSEASLPSEKDRVKLDKKLRILQTDPSSLFNVGGKSGHYLPEQAAGMGETSARAVNYLNSLRPAETKMSPLDGKPVANSVQKAVYNRALDIAEQPLIVLDSIKRGTITPQDVQSLRTMYPALYERLSQKLTNNMIEAVHKDQVIPYQSKLGLSLFLGQSLDSSMMPQSILAAQPKPQQPMQDQTSQGPKEPKHSSSALSKLPGSYMTSSQARAQRSLKQ